MTLSHHTQAVLLLTAHFTRPEQDEAKPLGPKEWGRFALWLKDRSRTPEQLLAGDPMKVLEGWNDKGITAGRIERLVNRGAALALALDKWLSAGLWVMTRSDPDYPVRLKQRLKLDSPPLLFGCGNPKLLNQGGLAVVGSRDADADDLEFSRGLGRLAAEQGHSIVSGGARGVDETAMLGALAAEGTVIGVLADSLLPASASARFRKHVMNQNLVLVSPFYPEAGFSAGNAMARNKYIYCLADAAAVVRTGTKGGTWSGAVENLKKGWVSLWVRELEDESAGNEPLIREGGRRLSGSLAKMNFGELLAASQEPGGEPVEATAAEPPKTAAGGHDASAIGGGTRPENAAAPSASAGSVPASAPPEVSLEFGFYELFLAKVQTLVRDDAKTSEELAAALDLEPPQIKPWLKRAVSEAKLQSLSKPIRYRWRSDLFEAAAGSSDKP